MITKNNRFVFLIIAMAIGSLHCNGEKNPLVETTVENLDSNNDSNVDWLEWLKPARELFKQQDANKDGKLESGEFSNQKRFSSLDKNADKYLDDSEYTKRYKKLFQQMNTNKDEHLDRKEMAAYFENISENALLAEYLEIVNGKQ